MKSFLEVRFDESDFKKRELIWRELIKVCFQRYVKKTDTVLDVGAGFCEFINNVICRNKIAIDSSNLIKKYADSDVIKIVKPFSKIPKKYFGRFDVIFMSNFLEHLEKKPDVVKTMQLSRKLLKRRGTLIIVQPNIDLIKEKYWDRIDHHIALNGRSVIEALNISGFQLKIFEKRFTPATMQSHLPISDFLIRMYLTLPSFARPFAGQSLFIASKR